MRNNWRGFNKEDILLTVIFSIPTLFMLYAGIFLSKDIYDYVIASIGLFGLGGCLIRQIACLIHNRNINIKKETHHVTQE